MLLRLVNYTESKDTDGRQQTGFLTDEGVVGFGRVGKACTSVRSACDCPDCWSAVLSLATCEACLAAARAYADWFAAQDAQTRGDLTLPGGQVKLLAPVARPNKLLCLAQNFAAHAAEANRHITHSGVSVADAMTPHVFMKPSSNNVRGDGDPIVITPTAQFIDYEAEVAVVIGREGKYIKAAEALDYVLGVTAINDVSERRLKIWDRKDEREWDNFFDWLNGKWMDSFAPMGPCLVPASDVDLGNLDITCHVNGEVRQEGNTGEMYHSVAQTIEYISHFMTLEVGDVIAMGTPAGVGAARDARLVAGDVVSVTVTGVGTLTNPVVAEAQ